MRVILGALRTPKESLRWKLTPGGPPGLEPMSGMCLAFRLDALPAELFPRPWFYNSLLMCSCLFCWQGAVQSCCAAASGICGWYVTVLQSSGIFSLLTSVTFNPPMPSKLHEKLTSANSTRKIPQRVVSDSAFFYSPSPTLRRPDITTTVDWA